MIILMIFLAISRCRWIVEIVLASCLLFVFYGVTEAVPLAIVFRALQAAPAVTILVRFGLLAFISMVFTVRILSSPITTDPSAWYFGSGSAILLVVLSLAAFGIYVVIGRR